MFTQSIRRQQPITLFAEGLLRRDFTFVDDTVAAVVKLSQSPAWSGATVVNVGHHRPVQVIEFVNTLAEVLGQQPRISYAPMQKADVALTCASEERLLSLIGDWPDTPLREGLLQFVDWLKGWDPMT